MKFKTLQIVFILTSCVMGIFVIFLASLYASHYDNSKNTQIKPTFNPEIAVNEYWDFSGQKMATFGGLKLYVNNTDRNVIYALDDRGKVVWTIWGKDYGFENYEIRQVNQKLFITALYKDELGNYLQTLHVFDDRGKLAWKQTFVGGATMRVADGNTVILENSASTPCNTGCGAICMEGSENACSENAIWAFDLNTGKVIWKNSTPNYHGTVESIRDGKILSHSGGEGVGQFKFDYIIDLKTGTFEQATAIVNYRELGQDSKTLFFNPANRQLIYREAFTTNTIWKLNDKSLLYQLVQRHLDGSLLVLVLKDIIFVNEYFDNINKVTSYAFSKVDGRFIWKKDFDSSKFKMWKFQDFNKVLVFGGERKSVCNRVCSYCLRYALNCTVEDIEMNSAYRNNRCNLCHDAEKNREGYFADTIRAVDEQTGNLLWKLDGTMVWFKQIIEERQSVLLEKNENGKIRQVELDLRNGKPLPITKTQVDH